MVIAPFESNMAALADSASKTIRFQVRVSNKRERILVERAFGRIVNGLYGEWQGAKSDNTSVTISCRQAKDGHFERRLSMDFAEFVREWYERYQADSPNAHLNGSKLLAFSAGMGKAGAKERLSYLLNHILPNTLAVLMLVGMAFGFWELLLDSVSDIRWRSLATMIMLILTTATFLGLLEIAGPDDGGIGIRDRLKYDSEANYLASKVTPTDWLRMGVTLIAGAVASLATWFIPDIKISPKTWILLFIVFVAVLALAGIGWGVSKIYSWIKYDGLSY